MLISMGLQTVGVRCIIVCTAFRLNVLLVCRRVLGKQYVISQGADSGVISVKGMLKAMAKPN